MTVIKLTVLARRLHYALVAVGVMTLLGWLDAQGAINIDFVLFSRPHKIPDIEVIELVTVVMLAQLTRPRFWEWERLSGWRIRFVAAATTLACIALPLIPLFVAVGRLPDQVPWGWLVSNELTISSAVVALSAVIGPLLGGGTIIVLYFGYAFTDDLLPKSRGYLPLASYPGPHGYWTPAVLALAVVLVIALYTRGASGWSRRLVRNAD